jgi:hypothetical protein
MVIKEDEQYYIFENNNKYSKNKYTKEEAIIANATLVDCTNCINCIKCYTCDDCDTCIDCYNCYSCYKCYDCKDCPDCYDCNDCYYCKDCIDCIYCIKCTECNTCLNCNNCKDCTNGKNCLNCINCTNCENSSNCVYKATREDSASQDKISDKKDYKDLNGKLPLQDIDPIALTTLGEVMAYGIKKYGSENRGSYKNGNIDVYVGALLRHLTAYQSGEEVDAESGMSHFSHLFFNAYALVYLSKKKGR